MTAQAWDNGGLCRKGKLEGYAEVCHPELVPTTASGRYRAKAWAGVRRVSCGPGLSSSHIRLSDTWSRTALVQAPVVQCGHRNAALRPATQAPGPRSSAGEWGCGRDLQAVETEPPHSIPHGVAHSPYTADPSFPPVSLPAPKTLLPTASVAADSQWALTPGQRHDERWRHHPACGRGP